MKSLKSKFLRSKSIPNVNHILDFENFCYKKTLGMFHGVYIVIPRITNQILLDLDHEKH